jgi:hypothetical protein
MDEKSVPSAEGKAARGGDENLERIQEYAWSWFSYHAEQRTSMFNYSLAAAALLAAGYGAALDKFPIVAAAIGYVGFLVMACFVVLDYRNRRLVEYGEQALRYVEAALFKQAVDKVDPTRLPDLRMPAGILVADWIGADTGSRFWKELPKSVATAKHKVFLPFVECLVTVAFLAGGVAATWWAEDLAARDPGYTEAIEEAAEIIGAALEILRDTDALPSPPAAAPAQ